jgi:hypothetical protein
MIEFYATSGTDALKGEAVNNPRASSLSIFDWDLKGRPVSLTTGDGSKTFSTERLFSLNSFNFDAATDILLKRAVGYSAGLIDYFFRGKLEVEGKGDDQILVTNATKEAMRGDFGLYYDDAKDVRYPVVITACKVGDVDIAVEGGKCKGAELAAANPNPGTPLQVTFTQPTDPAPKAQDAFTLVFAGDLGEEKASDGNVGAVVGKSLNAPNSGALYLLGLDRLRRRVLLKADQTGTREVEPGEFHPLRALLILDNTGRSLTTSYMSKQVAFTRHAFGYSYETLAANVGEYSQSDGTRLSGWVKSKVPGAIMQGDFLQTSGVSWKAKSPDPLVGEFIFTIPYVNISYNNYYLSEDNLQYFRTFKDPAGNSQTMLGSIPLPKPSWGPGYYLFRNPRSVFISEDGLTLSGFTESLDFDRLGTATTKSVAAAYDLKISLAEVPTLSFVKSMDSVASFARENQTSDKRTNGNPISVTLPCDPARPELTGTPSTRDYSSQISEKYDNKTFVGYFNGALRSVRSMDNAVRLATIHIDYLLIYGDCSPIWRHGFDRGKATDYLRWDRSVQFADNTIDRTAWDYTIRDVNLTGPWGGITFTTMPPGYLGGTPNPNNGTWDITYQGQPNPTVTRNTIPLPGGNTESFTPLFVTDRSVDAIYTSTKVYGWQAGYAPVKFRNEVLTGKSIVVDASPLGEVFLATTDLSVVVHEPKRGPKVVIPPTVTQLLAAIWM